MEGEVSEPKWRPLTAIQRRILGVLLEKAKTTPSGYPMSLNAITTGCNQKSNRDPQMNLEPELVEDALEEMRLLGAIGIIEGGGRVPKYRHYAEEWFGIDRPQGAVIAELLLRGQQTVGELRGRAARMNKSITDVAALRPILTELRQKGLVVSLTPEGRGQIVTHGVYPEHELPSGVEPAEQPASAGPSAAPAERATPPPAETPSVPAPSSPPPSMPPQVTRDMFNELQLDVAELRAEVSRLRTQLEQLEDLIR